MSSDHLVVVEKLSDFRWTGQAAPADTDVVTAEAFIAEMQQAPSGAARRPRKIINLCREYGYLSLGYYCSLLAEARGDRVTPSVETILDLLQRHARQALLPQLDRLVGGLDAVPRSVDSLALHVYFGHVDDAALSQLARKAFELFRCPLLEIQLERAAGSAQWHVASVESLDPRDVDTSRDTLFIRALTEFTRRRWHPARPVTAPKMDLAILHDPDDPLPPSSTRTLRHMADIGRAAPHVQVRQEGRFRGHAGDRRPRLHHALYQQGLPGRTAAGPRRGDAPHASGEPPHDGPAGARHAVSGGAEGAGRLLQPRRQEGR